MNLQSIIAKMISDRKGQLYLVLIITVLSQLLTAVMNIANSWIWWHRIDLDLILIGCIDSFFVTSLVAPAAIYLIRRSFNLDELNHKLQQEINERTIAQEALRKSEDKYRTLIETTDTGFVIIDQNGLVQDANSEYVRLTGHSDLSEIVGKSVIEWTADYEKEKNAVAVKACFAEGSIRNFEIDYVDVKGNITPIEINATCLEIDGKTQTITICRDITERKQAAESLTKSEEKFRKAFYTSPDSVNINRLEDGMYISINPGFTKIMGYTEEDIIGRTSIEYNIWNNVEDRKKLVTGLKKDGEVINYEASYRTKFGEIRYGLMSASIINLNGIPHIINITKDVTDRKLIEDALRQSEEKYRTILESIQDGYFEMDIAGNYTFVNDAECKNIGYTKDELIGMNNRQFQDETNARKMYQLFSRLYKTGEPVKTSDIEIIRKDGTIVINEVSASLIRNTEGKPVGFRGISRNITERKQAEAEKRNLEERLQRAEKMEALGTLAGGVAHDLNNVLGVIVGYSELLLNEVDKTSPIRPRLTNIMNGSEKAAAIVQDLLTLARRGVPGRKVLNLNKIILDYQNSPELEKLSSYHAGVHIKFNLEASLLNISGSPVHLGKVISNLVSNAAEAMPKGGKLTIKTANQYLDKPVYGYDNIREGDYVVLSVIDTGEGIASADLQRIFEPFYTKKVMGRSGTGLGLAVIWGTVKDHQGYINVQSEEGKGSIFTIYFPITRKEVSAESASVSIAEYMGKGETILVVDDVKEQRDLAVEMLQKLNYKASSVASGEEAIAYINDHRIDLMILDMIMDPGMDGLDTYRGVLKIRPKQKAIIVSGFSESERVNEAHALGAGAYLRKPYVIEKLGLAVRKELDKK